MTARTRTTGLITAVLLGLSLSVASPVARAEEGNDCTPDLEGRLEGQNQDAGRNLTTLQFAVDVRVAESDCMAVHFELIIKEGLVDGSEKIVVLGQRVKIVDGNLTHYVQHQMSAENDLVNWEVKFTGCKRCGPGD